MVKKGALTEQLGKYNDFEELFIERLTNFIPLVHHEGVDKDYDRLLKETIARLKKDSQKHKQIVQELIDYVDQSPKNEF